MSDWPIVNRTDELREASNALDAGSGFHGVVLVGEAGVGKTTVARVLAESLVVSGHTTRFVLGTETGQAVPLGAFHGILQLTDAHEPPLMLSAAHRALAQETNLVVVVDDAQHLDPMSALLVQQLAAHGATKLIVTIRSGEGVSDAVTALWKERYLLRLDIGPFGRGHTEELLSAVLDGDLDDQVVDRFHRLAAGSPLVLRGLVNAAIADGVLVRDDHLWRLVGPLRPGSDLSDLIGARLDTLAADELDVLETVSVAEVLDWAILHRLCDPDAIARAEKRGAIQLVTNGSQTIAQPGHPIVGAVARQRCGVSRSRQLNGALADQLSAFLCDHERSSEADVRTQIRLAQFMTLGDTPPDLAAITQAAESAVTMSNLVLGEQFARFAVDHGAGMQARIALADAISWQGRGEEAETILAECPPGPDAEDDEAIIARWGCLRAANLFFGCGHVDSAREVLNTIRDRVVSPPLPSLVVAIDVAFAFFAGDLPTAATLGVAALDADMIPAAAVWAAMATAGALAMSGRFDEVAPIAKKGIAAAEQCESGPQRYSIGLAEVLGHTAAGDLGAAEQVCDRYSAMTAGVPQAEAIATALAGRVHLARGQLAAAAEALQKSLWAMAESLPAGWLMLVAAWLAQTEAARANREGAAAALARAEQANGPQVAVFLPELELARAWERAAMGETTAAQHHAVRAAAHAARGGMHAVEMSALHAALRFGDRSHHARLRKVTALLDGPMAAAVAAHSRGLADLDGERLDGAADRFEQIGALAMAADAAAHAARAHARAGRRISELESSTRAHWLASQCGLLTPVLRSVQDPLPITDREREIANLVGEGLTNRDVADRLGVSVRTIEGHLYRIFAKLQIEDRDQLARLVRVRPATHPESSSEINSDENWGSRLL